MKVRALLLIHWLRCYNVLHVQKNRAVCQCMILVFWKYASSMCMSGGHCVNQSMLLTIPGVLGLSAGLWVKLPLWLVETVCDFLLLRPMASIDWLLLRMTRYRERRGDTPSGDPLWDGVETKTHWLIFHSIIIIISSFRLVAKVGQHIKVNIFAVLIIFTEFVGNVLFFKQRTFLNATAVKAKL